MQTTSPQFFRLNIDTDPSGIGTMLLKVPGTFTGGTPKYVVNAATGKSALSNGRFLQSIRVAAKNPQRGDALDSLSVEDIDGVVPTTARAGSPLYPTLRRFDDAPPGTLPGVFMPDAGFVFDRGDNAVFLPAGIYLKIGVRKAEPVEATFLVSIAWFAEE